jgi:hypothetical protein
MEALYRWRVQEKDKFGKSRWRLLRAPMTEDTARFWARNNNRVIERVDMPVTPAFMQAAASRAAETKTH